MRPHADRDPNFPVKGPFFRVTKIRASFLVLNFSCDPAEITRIIAAQPTQTWRKGDAKPKTAAKHPTSGWKLTSDLPDSSGVADHISNVVSRVYPRAKGLLSIGNFEATVSILIEIRNFGIPSIFLDREMVEKISELNAGIDIDLYVRQSSEKSDESE